MSFESTVWSSAMPNRPIPGLTLEDRNLDFHYFSIAKSRSGVKIGDDTLSWKLYQCRTRQLSHELRNKPDLGLRMSANGSPDLQTENNSVVQY